MKSNNLIRDIPASEGMANVLRRAEQFRLIRWTPVDKMPLTAGALREYNASDPVIYHAAWRPVTGLPYSSARFKQKFIGYNVSLETFMTALANPKSVLYTRNLTNQGIRMSSWYGCVCSVFVSNALQLPCQRICKEWGKYDDMPGTGASSHKDIKLCDILCSDGHVALVTGVIRREDGSVHSIEVSESVCPLVVSTSFSPAEFDNYWLKTYKVYRYTGIDGVRYTPSPYVRLDGDPELAGPQPNCALLPDYGNKANYELGEPVEFNVMQPGWEKLIVEDKNGTVFEQQLENPGIVVFVPQRCGLYHACCVRGNERSDPVEFAVVKLTLKYKEPVNGQISISFDLAESDKLIKCMVAKGDKDGLTQLSIHFSEADNLRRQLDFDISSLAPGPYRIKSLAGNEYGQYMSNYIDFNFT